MRRKFVFPFDDAHRLLDAFLEVAVLHLEFALDDRRLADVVVQLVVAGEIRLRLRPRHLELVRGAHRVPFLRCDDRQQVLDVDHLRAGNVLDRAFVDRHRHGAGDLRPDHARMQHAGQAHVRRHFQRAEHFSGQVAARRRFADDLEILRLLDLGLAVDRKAEAKLAVPLHGRVEVPAADQFGVGNAFGRVRRVMDDPVGHREPLGRDAELGRGLIDHQAARLGRHLAQVHAGARHAGRGAGAAHVHRAAGVAHDEVDAVERHVEFLGDHLRDRCAEPLAAVDLAVVGGDRAVLVDGDIGIELVGLERTRRGEFMRRCIGPIGGGERDDESAGGGNESAAAELLCHVRLPQIACAARLTARIAAPWVPQRQITFDNASLISFSVGCGFSSRKAAAVMIQPLMQ